MLLNEYILQNEDEEDYRDVEEVYLEIRALQPFFKPNKITDELKTSIIYLTLTLHPTQGKKRLKTS